MSESSVKFFVTCLNTSRRPGYLTKLIERLKKTDGPLCNKSLLADFEKYDMGMRSLTDKRCMGWYESQEDAETVIRDNAMDIHECSFKYAVVESVRPGPYPVARAISWFEWKGDNDTGEYVPCERPPGLDSVFGFCF